MDGTDFVGACAKRLYKVIGYFSLCWFVDCVDAIFSNFARVEKYSRARDSNCGPPGCRASAELLDHDNSIDNVQ